MALSENLKRAIFIAAYVRAKAGKPSLVRKTSASQPAPPLQGDSRGEAPEPVRSNPALPPMPRNLR